MSFSTSDFNFSAAYTTSIPFSSAFPGIVYHQLRKTKQKKVFDSFLYLNKKHGIPIPEEIIDEIKGRKALDAIRH